MEIFKSGLNFLGKGRWEAERCDDEKQRLAPSPVRNNQ